MRIESPDERSQWQWWAARRDGGLDFRNHGVYGERTDEIAARLEDAARGADVLIAQGGINDVVQNRPVEEAARNLAGMVEHGRRLGLRVALADVLPWNNGDARAANDIVWLNILVSAIAEGTERAAAAVSRHAGGSGAPRTHVRRLDGRRRPSVDRRT